MVNEVAQIVQTQPPDLITSIFGAPWIYILGIAIVFLFVVRTYKSKEPRPETRPWWGRIVRRNVIKQELIDRTNVWGNKSKVNLFRGFNRIGKVIKYELITKKVKRKNKYKDSIEDIEIYDIAFRNFGFIAWLKSLFGKYEHILLTPESIELRVDVKKPSIIIDPKVHIIADSGVWTVAKFGVMDFIDELNVKADLENTKGFVSDFPRRLSNLDPGQAIKTEGISHVYNEEERARKSKISQWTGKK